jgi:hypothetical protein
MEIPRGYIEDCRIKVFPIEVALEKLLELESILNLEIEKKYRELLSSIEFNLSRARENELISEETYRIYFDRIINIKKGIVEGKLDVRPLIGELTSALRDILYSRFAKCICEKYK